LAFHNFSPLHQSAAAAHDKKNIKSKKKGKNKIEARPLKKENVADVLIRTKEEEKSFRKFLFSPNYYYPIIPPPQPAVNRKFVIESAHIFLTSIFWSPFFPLHHLYIII
jgi:hypothetical protein